MVAYGNIHSIGAVPSLQSVRAEGFDVKFQETHDRHRLFQALDTTGALLGTVGDANYKGFFTEAEALAFLATNATWTAAVSAAGGVQDYRTPGSQPLVGADGHINGIDAQFRYGEELPRP